MIKDSGNRRTFESGAVRDIQEGKGRCDLLPLDVVADFLGAEAEDAPDFVLDMIDHFVTFEDEHWLLLALEAFRDLNKLVYPTLFLELSVHFEEGAKKYGENNWRKGLPVNCYIDSAVRHYLKWLRGDKDERHDRAFCWNIVCAIWTCRHMPELKPSAMKKEEADNG